MNAPSSYPRESPLISVITVVYNDRANLVKTLASVGDQVNCSFEYILIDGASEDGSEAEWALYKKRIDVLVSEPDKGIYDAMNKGLQRATGTWIHFLNAGDIYHGPHSLSRLSQLVGEGHAKDIWLGEALHVNHRGNNYVKGKALTEKNLFSGIPFCHQAMLVRKDMFTSIGPFNLNYPLIADYEWLVRYYRSQNSVENIGFSGEIWVHYLVGGLSYQMKKQVERERLRVAKSLFPRKHIIGAYISFAKEYAKASILPWLEKSGILWKWRKIKYQTV